MSQHQEVLFWEEVVAADICGSVFMSSGLRTGETISPTPAESIVFFRLPDSSGLEINF